VNGADLVEEHGLLLQAAQGPIPSLPALVRLADHFGTSRLAALEQEHTSSGAHRSTSTPFPDWVPEDVLREGARLRYEDVIAQLPGCLTRSLTAG
jgi:hypothetical protein